MRYALSTMEYDREISPSVAPMFHIFGHHHCVIHPIYLGSTHVLVRQYKPEIVFEQLSKHKVTLFAGGPSTVYVEILAAEGIKSADLSHLKICCAGSSPFSEHLLKNWEKTVGWRQSQAEPGNTLHNDPASPGPGTRHRTRGTTRS